MREPTARQNELAGEVIGAAIEVHKETGPGFIEQPYDNALAVELELRGIPFVRQPVYDLYYKGRLIDQRRLDFVIDGQLVVEAKAVEKLLPLHDAQVISYLKMTKITLGLLINFNVPVLKDGIRRIVYSGFE